MDNDITNTMNEIKSSLEYESKFSKEHRGWMVDTISEIKQDVKKINGRVRSNEITIGWMKGIVGMITAGIGWLIGKEF
tara:strand:+ start:1376 stop:1609 length:234 start_codon:yes stop_codon:yes gene_type:complete